MHADHDAVWADTTDGGLLRQLFGHYPTMHDAVIRSINVDRVTDQVVMVVDYNEVDDETQAEGVVARIRLEWSGVRQLDFPLGDEDLLGLDFTRQGDRILTTIETWPGVYGTIVSDTAEAVLMQMDPPDDDQRAWIRFS